MRIRRRTWSLALALALAAAGPLAAQGPVVRAVLFYSPTCPHCHKVITQDLPPLVRRYGDSLLIVGVDVSTADGAALIRDAATRYGVPMAQLGVPLMVVDDQVLMGDQEIPDRLPGIVEAGLAHGGTNWPDLPRLRQALVARGVIQETPAAADTVVARAQEEPAAAPDASQEPAAAPTAPARNAATPAAKPTTPPAKPTTPAATPSTEAGGPAPKPAPKPEAGAANEAAPGPEPAAADTTTRAAASPPKPAGQAPSGTGRQTISTGLEGATTAANLSMAERFSLDPLANSVALFVLFLMIGVVGATVSMATRRRFMMGAGPRWLVPVLALIGLGIAIYLSFVEVTGAEAVCGPVGDCNTVQQSPYAHLFGIPMGVLGAVGYVVIALLWAAVSYGRGVWRLAAAYAMWGSALFGVLFSIYLTFLEPFVIGATCAWCLGSAVIMTLLLVAATGTLSVVRPPAAVEADQPPALV